MLVGYIHPNKNKLVNTQELLLLLNLSIMYVVSYQGSDQIVFNVMISLAFVQFCTIVFYHFLTYTCHFSVMAILQTMRDKLTKFLHSKTDDNHQNCIALLNTPECAHLYNEYRDGLVSDDF